MPDEPDTRLSLIARLAAPADQAAWSEFVTLYEPLVYRLARRKGLQDADARDLCQEVFRAVAGAVGRWDPAGGTFRGWLLRIARNLLINLLARERRHPRGTGGTDIHALLADRPAPADDEASALFDAEYARRAFEWAADAVRGEFTPATWEAFRRTALDGRRAKEVGAELGMSAGAVYIARSRVLARIRRRVEEFDPAAAGLIGGGGDGGPV